LDRLFGKRYSFAMSHEEETFSQKRGAEKRAIIREHVFFATLTAPQIDRLSSCIVSKSVGQGATIFSKGDPGSKLFAIRKGRVKISVPSVDGHDAVFNFLDEGQIFGEIALLDGGPRTAAAIAVTDCELFLIERRDFLPLVHAEPAIAVHVIEILCGRLRRISEQTEYVMFHNLPSRLAKALLQLAGSTSDAQEIKVNVTQRELGDMVGMARESINKQLRNWQRKKWVRLERGGLIILSAEALVAIADSDST
jgi:CRP/FNR family transcriptional regulator, cyclic AMP receptor protein